jgi:hypothetical protein
MDLTKRRQLTEHNLSDDAGGDRDKSIIGAYLNPVITSRRRTQAMAAPIIDYIMSAAIFARKALASVQVMPRAGPPLIISPVIVCAHMVVAAIGLKAVAAIVAMLAIVIATVIVLMIIALGERGASRR